jgi:hypothetical protein
MKRRKMNADVFADLTYQKEKIQTTDLNIETF